MKVKTSVTLSQDLLTLIDQFAKGENNRSAFVELALKTYIELLQRNKRDQTDLQIIDRLSDKLNQEALDVLRYQTDLQR